jgi:hypothetical protein
MACSDDDSTKNSAPTASLYAITSQVQTPDGSSTYVALADDIPSDVLKLDQALELNGYGDIHTFQEKMYIADGETLEIGRYAVSGNALIKEETVSFKDRGFDWLGEPYFADATHAYSVNGAQYKLVEWNPEQMTITAEHDLSALKVEGWGSEYRGGFMRRADGKLFVYWAYNNDRKEFMNDFVLGVFDTKTNAFKVITHAECPSTAGFGGFFDEASDLYLISDSFGGFTYFGNAQPKSACVLRIKNGEDELDRSYVFKPSDALGNGLAPWGLYYAGNGIAYTTAVDPAQLANYESLYAFIFAKVHDGWALDLRSQTATKIQNMPPDGVGFESVTVGGNLLIPRSTAKTDIYDVEDVQTAVYTLSPNGSEATKRFSMPGYLGNVIRLR